MTKKLLALSGWIVAAGLLVVVVVLLARPGTKHNASTAVSPKPTPLKGLAQQLVDRLDTGRDVTFHATYKVVGQTATPGQTLRLEVWRKPPLLRQETLVSGAAGPTKELATFFNKGTATTSCTRTATGAWTCAPSATGQLDGPDALLQQLTGQLEGVTVVGSQKTVAGVPSSCYDLTISATSSKICLRADGVPTLISTGNASLELVSLTTDVPSSVMTPPATTS